MSKSRDLDFRSINLGTVDFFRCTTKKKAKEFAKGWLVKDVSTAANRFCVFWIVCQCVGADILRVLNQDGSVSDIPHPGYF